jgi:ethylene receptor
LIKPIAAVKRLSVSLTLALDTPVHAVGDEKRLVQILLNVVANAIKFTKEGYIAIEVSAPKQEYIRDWEAPELYPAINGEFYLQVQVEIYFLEFGVRVCVCLFIYLFLLTFELSEHADPPVSTIV